MPNDPLLHLIGLAKKAGKLEVGEEPVGAACRAHRAKLLLLAADAAPNTVRRAAHFGEAGKVLWLELPFSKSELGRSVGRTSCAMVAVMDAGFAASISGKLRALDPERYDAAAAQLEARAARVLQRQQEQRRHEKKLQRGNQKPWAPPPSGAHPPKGKPRAKSAPGGRPAHPPAKPGRDPAAGRRIAVRGKLPPKK